MYRSTKKTGTVVNFGLAISVLALVGFWPGWRAALEAQNYYTEYYAEVRCEAGDYWGEHTLLWRLTIATIGDISECQARVQSAGEQCPAEGFFVVETPCTQL